MAGNPTGKRELREQLLEPGLVLADVRINLTPSAFEVNVAHNRRAAVTGTGNIKHIQVILLMTPVQVHIDEVLARRRYPSVRPPAALRATVSALLQQRIVVEINLADR